MSRYKDKQDRLTVESETSKTAVDSEVALQEKIEDLLARLYGTKKNQGKHTERIKEEQKVVQIRSTKHKVQKGEQVTTSVKNPIVSESVGTLIAKIKKKIAPITKR